MPKTPASYPDDCPRCDLRLPDAALAFRQRHGLVRPAHLNAINVTAWLYRDDKGEKKVQVNPNTPIADLIKEFGPADTPDAEVGIHSEAKAAQWFIERRHLRVLQIFSERVPCARMCGPMLRQYFSGVPWYFYYDRRSWLDARGRVEKRASDVLSSVYGL